MRDNPIKMPPNKGVNYNAKRHTDKETLFEEVTRRRNGTHHKWENFNTNTMATCY